ncbi:MAG: DUF1194 domain-containing protein [Gemmatimonadaceae bacterium]|nr:DUF1194 domain-containing protein [Acetobacteraceae bacterium]
MWRVLSILAVLASPVAAQTERVDVALVLAVDVSESVDAARFALQMEGIAAAFEAPEVQASVLSGRHRSMLIALVQWSNRPTLSVPWTLLTSNEDVRRFAGQVRRLRRADKGFTCMAVALRSITDKLLTQVPVPADRVVVDVSGDGHDNCNPQETVDDIRDELAAADITINGLPILEGNEAGTLERWYRDHVIGGPNAFLVPAAGFVDFERAMRRKFVTEISGAPCSDCVRAANR